MTSITLEQEIEVRLDALAARSGRSKADYVREAILRGLEDIEDIEDAATIMARIARGEEKTVPLDDLVRRLGLDN